MGRLANVGGGAMFSEAAEHTEIFIEELCGKDPAKIKTRGKCNHCGWKIGPTVKVNAPKTVICNMLQHCCHPVAGMLVRGIPGT